MWRAKFYQASPKILEDHPKARFLFLTLTVKNCELAELRSTLARMNQSWQRLTQVKDWPAQGWVKAVEVTRGQDDSAHPHFHALLMVNERYFKHGYLSQARWTELWQSSLRVNYIPVVDVRVIRPRRGTPEGEISTAMMSAITETLKYSVKPSDVLRSDHRSQVPDQEWLVTLTKQLHKTRAIATGGMLRKYLTQLSEEPADLIHADEEGLFESDTESPRAYFGWREKISRYSVTDSVTEPN